MTSQVKATEDCIEVDGKMRDWTLILKLPSIAYHIVFFLNKFDIGGEEGEWFCRYRQNPDDSLDSVLEVTKLPADIRSPCCFFTMVAAQ